MTILILPNNIHLINEVTCTRACVCCLCLYGKINGCVPYRMGGWYICLSTHETVYVCASTRVITQVDQLYMLHVSPTPMSEIINSFQLALSINLKCSLIALVTCPHVTSWTRPPSVPCHSTVKLVLTLTSNMSSGSGSGGFYGGINHALCNHCSGFLLEVL